MKENQEQVKKVDPIERFIWLDDDGESPVTVVRYDDEARRETIQALLAESREMAK